jgi:hypothetical protein
MLRQEDRESQASPGYIVRPCLKKIKRGREKGNKIVLSGNPIYLHIFFSLSKESLLKAEIAYCQEPREVPDPQ